MEANDLGGDDVFNYLHEHGPGLLQKVRSHFLDQLRSREILGELLFGGGQYALEAQQDHVIDNVGLAFHRAPSHEVLLELNQGLAYFSLDLSLSFVHFRHIHRFLRTNFRTTHIILRSTYFTQNATSPQLNLASYDALVRLSTDGTDITNNLIPSLHTARMNPMNVFSARAKGIMQGVPLRRWIPGIIFCVLIGAPPVLGAPPTGKTPEEQGRNVFVTQDAMDLGFHDSIVWMTMTLINAAGQESKREMSFQTFEMKDDGDKTLITFQHPRDIKGTGLLSYEHIQKDDDQWLYLPALKRVKRIASKNKSGSFVGSEFSYEDLSSFHPEKYGYKYLREDQYEGKPAWVIERFPKDPNSGYTKIISWVDQSNYQTVKQEYFDRKGSPLKVQYMKENTKHLGKFWRPAEIIMDNLQTKKKTILKFSDWKFQQGLKESFFTKRSLERQR